MPKYILFFDNVRQAKTAPTVDKACDRAFRFASSCFQQVAQGSGHFNLPVHVRSNQVAAVTLRTATEMILTLGSLECWIEARGKGVIGGFNIFEEKALDRHPMKDFFLSCKVQGETGEPQAPAPTEPAKKDKEEDEIVVFQSAEALPALPLNYHKLPNPIQSVVAAEYAIFRSHLFYHLSKIEKPIEQIESEMGFTTGTLYALLDTIHMDRPTKKMVETLAKYFKVNPSEVYVDLVPTYTNTSKLWGEVVSHHDKSSP